MKKFLFTLAAMLMAVSAFAQSDAKYMYVNTPLTYEEDDFTVLVVSAEFPAYVSAFEANVITPEGMTVVAIEPGEDYEIDYLNALGRTKHIEPALATAPDDPSHFLVASSQDGYYWNEDSAAYVTYGAVKWEAGYYEEFLLVYVTLDENYHGGNVQMQTIPSSGRDPRGVTCVDLGDKGREDIITDATEPLPDPNPTKLDPAKPQITYVTNDDEVVVTVTWNESDGNQVYTGQYTYTRPEYGQPDESYEVEAYTEESATYNESEHATATIPVPAKDPVWQSVAAPEITYETTATQVIVTVTWPTSTGDKVYTGEYTYDRPAYGEADQSYEVEAYTTQDYPYEESTHATATIPVPAQDPVWQSVAAPVIEVVEMDDDYVYVEITWPTTTGNHVYTGELTYARGDADYSVDVEAYTEADYPYAESTHGTATIDVPAKPVVATKVYVKVTAANQLIAGAHYIFVDSESNVAMGPIEGGFGSVVAVTAVNTKGADKVEAPETCDLTLGGSVGAWTLMWADGQYLTAGNSTGLGAGTNATEWAITDNNGAINGYRAKHASYNRAIRKHNSYDRFGNYSTSDDNSRWAYIYIAEEDLPAEKLTPATPEINYTVGDDVVTVTITWNESDGNQVYTGEYTYTRPEYGQPDESYDVEAYTEESETYKESEHATETIEVPAKDPVWQSVEAPEINYTVGDDVVTVTIEWPTTTGDQVYTGEYTYTRPEYGQPDESYDVEAYTEADYPYEESTHATATIEVPAKDPVWQSVAAPVITPTVNETTVTVTIEWPTTTGEQVYTGEYTYDRTYEDQTFDVEAYTTEDYPYEESAHATATIEVPAMDKPVADEPVIEFVETKDGDVVTAVEVVVTNATEYHIWVNGEQVRGEKYYANYNEDLNIHVEAVNDPGYPYVANDAEDDYTLAKLEKKAVEDPVITYEVQDDKVVVTVTWPETDGEQVYTGNPSYDRTDEDYTVTVKAQTLEGETCLASNEVSLDITIPALPAPEVTATPEIVATPTSGGTGANAGHGYYTVTITCEDENADIEYRVQRPDGTWTEWMSYDDPFAVGNNGVEGDYVVEARAKDGEKEMSEVAQEGFTVTPTTGIDELANGKTVASVRYFNLNGQEMQEANGMTIVVTTYTDGTRSAVKMMK